MSEVKTKPKYKLDPNSAKAKLGKIVSDFYSNLWVKKEQGEMIGWCASNFPQEILRLWAILFVIRKTRRQR